MRSPRRRRTFSGLPILCAAFWDFSLVCLLLIILRRWFGVFRLCGGERALPCTRKGLLAAGPAIYALILC